MQIHKKKIRTQDKNFIPDITEPYHSGTLHDISMDDIICKIKIVALRKYIFVLFYTVSNETPKWLSNCNS